MCARVCVCTCHTCARSGRLPFQGLPELGSVQESRERERLGCRVWREAGGLGSGGAGRPSSQDGGTHGGGGRRRHLSVPQVFVQLLLALHVQGLRRIGPRSLPPSPPKGQCCGAEGGRGAVPAGASGMCDAPCQESPGLGPDRGGGMPGSLDEERFSFSAGQGSVSCVRSLGCGEVGELPLKRTCRRHLCGLKVKSLACLRRGRGAGSVPHC